MSSRAGLSSSFRLLQVSGGKGAIKIWTTKDWQEVLSLDADGAVFEAAAFMADQRWLVGRAQYNGGIKIWYALSSEEIEPSNLRTAAGGSNRVRLRRHGDRVRLANPVAKSAVSKRQKHQR